MQEMSRRILFYCLTLTLLLSTELAAAQQGDVRAVIEAENKEFIDAFSRGDSTALAALYTTDAQLFPTQSDIVSGKQAIEEFWQGVIDSGIKGATLTTLEVEGHGDAAYEVGTYTLTGEDGTALDTGKYVVIWKRDKGQWKLHRDIWNTSISTSGQ